MKNTIKIVFVIIASFVGAGFASGKEIFIFFFQYGTMGKVGIIVSSGIISFIIYKVCIICIQNKIYSYNEFCRYLVNKNEFARSLLNSLVNIFLLINFFIMVSGFASLFEQEFNINQTVGITVIIALNYFVSVKDIKGLVKISNLLVPIFVVFLGIIVIQKFSYCNFDNCYNYNSVNVNLFNNWFVKSILYASYNIIILIPVIIMLVKKIEKKKTSIIVSMVSFLLLTFLSFSIVMLLLMGDEKLFSLNMPIIGIISRYGKLYRLIYIFLIAISIFTTATSSCVSFLNNVDKKKEYFRKNLLIISIITFFISKISFGNMVNCLYPVLGGVGLIEIVIILYKSYRNMN